MELYELLNNNIFMNSIDYWIFKNAFIFIYIYLLVIIASMQYNKIL